ncbi:MAG: helix-turn-helix transcriptional regulator [Spirochaetes bacterium]|nr:helix-turn-helix transcriptional regulator [Spirochaetota bacterium]MBX3720444.1 helix-turn-helix transcriptional regulator [Turneriella sp.]
MEKCHIRNSIRKCRFLQDELTQQQLAERVGVTRQTIVAIENGKYSPTLELAFRIARVFDKPLEEIFSFVPDEAEDTNKK